MKLAQIDKRAMALLRRINDTEARKRFKVILAGKNRLLVLSWLFLDVLELEIKDRAEAAR